MRGPLRIPLPLPSQMVTAARTVPSTVVETQWVEFEFLRYYARQDMYLVRVTDHEGRRTNLFGVATWFLSRESDAREVALHALDTNREVK